jgi:3-oxoacyl-(acyl-carrier-protein) synthase
LSKRIVITGIGIVNPCGIGKEEFWENVTKGESSIKPIERFDTEGYPLKVAGEISGFNPSKYINKRVLKKVDVFTHYALVATEFALHDANFEINESNEYKSGIFFGNNSGGWDICEQGFKEMYNDGPQMVNPWQATAWFPTAAQGYISINYKIKGFSKTFIADRVSGSSALYYAMFSILSGKNEVAIVGGTEAPLTPFGTICYHESGEMSTESNPKSAIRPFDPNSSGIVLGEGSTVLILEELEYAKKRNAKIYGELLGSAMTYSNPTESIGIEKCINKTLRKSGLSINDIDLIIPEGNGAKICDDVEAEAINKICKDSKIDVITPKTLYGHLYGAALPTDIACALLNLQSDKLPICKNINDESKCINFNLTDEQELHCDNILVNSRSREGVNVSFVVSKFKN